MTPAEWLESQPLQKPPLGGSVFTRRMFDLIEDDMLGPNWDISGLHCMHGTPGEADPGDTFRL